MNDLINLALNLHKSGNLKGAIDLYRSLLRDQPVNPQINFLLGIAYIENGQFETGIQHLDKVLALYPNDIDALNSRGVAFRRLGRSLDAIKSFKSAIAINPNITSLHINLGNAFREFKELESARVSYLKALDIEPENLDALINLGELFNESNNPEEALPLLQRALNLDQNDGDVYASIGNTLLKLKRFEEALASYSKAIECKPYLAEWYSNRGVVYEKLKLFDRSLEDHNKAIEIKPDSAKAYYNRANALLGLSNYHEALANYNKAIQLKPDYAEAYKNRSVVLHELKYWNEELDDIEKAFTLNPDIDYLLGDKLYAHMNLCNWVGYDDLITGLLDGVAKGSLVSMPGPLLAVIDSPEIHQAVSLKVCEKECPKAIQPDFKPMTKGAKIKIGYFSADFHDHATMHLMTELFEKHDKNLIELIAFSFGPVTNDVWQTRVKNTFDAYIDCHQQSDVEIARISRELGIDIAVDLKGLTRDSRTGIFAAGAAPIQVNFLGYPGTMGADYIDYLIADELLIPERSRHFYTEKIAYLPDCYQPNCRNREVSNKLISRSDFGLPETEIIFGSFNNNCKITPEVFKSWIRILREVEGSVLWLYVSNPTVEGNLRRQLEAGGIDPSRLIIAQSVPIDDHLNRMRLADVMLDTFPYGAHTTCSDALRVGLPVVTMRGESFASRVASSLLTTIGLPELITDSLGAYEHLVITLAKDPRRLAEIRSRLENNAKSSSLFDPELFARNLESLYTSMHQRYREGLAPDHIRLR